MFIYKIKEGEQKHIGINWSSSENTFLSIILCLPIWIFLPKNYYNFYTDHFYYGWQYKVCFCRIRFRRWAKFPKNINRELPLNINIHL